jgi:hypothetical protein
VLELLPMYQEIVLNSFQSHVKAGGHVEAKPLSSEASVGTTPHVSGNSVELIPKSC